MDTYVILRRNGWRTAEDLQEAAARSTAEGERMPDDIRWIRSYVTAEADGTVGTVCVYQASSPEAVRAHAGRADLPVDGHVVLDAEVRVVQVRDKRPLASRSHAEDITVDQDEGLTFVGVRLLRHQRMTRRRNGTNTTMSTRCKALPAL